jgi:uncharacterized protein
MLNKFIRSAIILTIIAAFPVIASTPEPPVVPKDYVVDLAGIIKNDARSQLNTMLHDLEHKTTAQVLILTIQSLDGQSIDEFAFNTKEKWKLGQKGKDNGVLVVVSLKDRKYRFEVGYGLESVLPDSLVGAIGREHFVSNFRKGDYSTGIFNAIQAVIMAVAANESGNVLDTSRYQYFSGNQFALDASRFQHFNGEQEEWINIKGVILALLPIIVLFYIFVRWPLEANKKKLRELWMGNGYGGYGSGGFGGGGFGGFGGGSFGGGGGGSGGGGGASGGW